MGRMVGIAEFKANCTRLIAEMERDGVPITITKRGKAVAELKPARDPTRTGPFGCMKGTVTIMGDIVGPLDPDWEAEWEAKWDALGFPVIDAEQ